MSQFNPSSAGFNDADFPESRPGWPTGLGIFSIVWGSLGLLCGACATAMTFIQGPMLEWAAKMQAQGPQNPNAPTMPTGPVPVELQPNVAQILGAVLHPLGGLILLVAGIMLCMRKPAARMLHLVYAVVSVIGTAIGMVGVVMFVNAFNAFEQANPSHEWVDFFKTMSNPSMMIVQSAGMSVVSVLFPLFVFIWFLFIKKRPEDMTGANQDVYV